MRRFIVLLAAVLAAAVLGSCGGGDPAPPAPPPEAVASAPLIRYEGIWSPTRVDSTRVEPPARLTLRPLAGQASISANPVARVEVQAGQGAPVVLAAPNSTSAAGQPQFVFQFPGLADAPGCLGSRPTLQIRVTVEDSTGFAYTKNFASCAFWGSDQYFGGFSDYGTTTAKFSYTASSPVTAWIERNSRTGYQDMLVPVSQGPYSATLPAAEDDRLSLNIRAPVGTRATARIEAGGGTFAESALAATNDVQYAGASLDCCGPRPPVLGSAVDVMLVTVSPGLVPEESYTYSFRVIDPATGTVIGSQSGTTYTHINFPPLKVQRGHVIEMEATPNHPRGSVGIGANLSKFGGGGSVGAYSNEVGAPARFRVYCCAP